MRIVFMGSPDFAVASLEKLVGTGHTIAAVVSGPDKKRGRGSALTPTPVKACAMAHSIPVIEADNMRDPEFHRKLEAIKPDLFVVVAFRVLPQDVLKVPNIGSINLHASLLPAYRGAAPIHRAVMNGENHTGLTVFFLDERVDTGQYIAQQKLDIGPDETTGELYERMMHAGADLLEQSIRAIAGGNYTLTPQDDSKATAAPKLWQQDCLIDFSKHSSHVHNQVRGISPFPAAFTFVDGKRFKVFRSRPGPDIGLPPNELHLYKEKLLVSCMEPTTLELVEVQIEGKKVTSGVAFYHGYQGAGKVSSES